MELGTIKSSKKPEDYEIRETVVHIPTRKCYDFGYIGASGRAIIYNEGESSMQDARAVSFDDIIPLNEWENYLKPIKQMAGILYPGITICYVCHDGNGNYLMNRRGKHCRDEQGKWDFGGGSVEVGYQLKQVVRKELQEEYNAGYIPSKHIVFLDRHELFRWNEQLCVQTHWIAMIYLVQVDRSVIKNNEPHKFDEIGWFTLDQLPNNLHPLAPIEVEMVKRYLTAQS